MNIRYLGYACINDELSSRKNKVSTSRTMRKETFAKEGLKKAGELALANVGDLLKILEWNLENNIYFFRMSSDMIPWSSEYKIESLSQWTEIRAHLEAAGAYAKAHKMRLTSHPGPFNKLCSSKESLITSTIHELETHSLLMDYMELSHTPYNAINIHIGGAYNDKIGTLKTWRTNWSRLSTNLKSRLTIENDDKNTLYDTKDLYHHLYENIGIPIVFDFFHHRCYHFGTTNEEKMANLALSTWSENIIPKCHWSESRAEEMGDHFLRKAAHSDYCYGPLPFYDLPLIDLMIESKKKEKSVKTLWKSMGIG